jgi:hypothetical protein
MFPSWVSRTSHYFSKAIYSNQFIADGCDALPRLGIDRGFVCHSLIRIFALLGPFEPYVATIQGSILNLTHDKLVLDTRNVTSSIFAI